MVNKQSTCIDRGKSGGERGSAFLCQSELDHIARRAAEVWHGPTGGPWVDADHAAFRDSSGAWDEANGLKLSESDIRAIHSIVKRSIVGAKVIAYGQLAKGIRGTGGYTVISFCRTAGMAQRGNEWFIDVDFRETYCLTAQSGTEVSHG